MTEKISLKDLEQGLFRDSIQDGILDIQIGLLLLMFVLPIYLSPALGDFWSSAIFLPFWFLVIFGFRAYRKKVIQPRIGTIKYGTYRKKRLMRLNIIIVIVNVIALILGVYSFFNNSALGGWAPQAMISIILLIGFSLAGYMMDTPRLYLYGVLISTAPVIGEYLYRNHGASHHGFPITFGSLSVVLVAIGLIILTRLLRKFPLPPAESLL
jgi:cation transport ATPase